MPRFRGFGQDVQASDPMRAQSFRTQRSELPEDLWQPLYDRVNVAVAAAARTLSFFSTPKGGQATLITGIAAAAARVKTYRDTNMENANVVPTKMFKFVGISLAIFHQTPGVATDAQDRDRLMNNAYFRFRIVDKDIMYIPLVYLPAVNPLQVAATTATNITIIGSAGGGGNNVPMYKLPIPITLNPYENFTVEINVDAVLLSVDMDIGVLLQGYMRRPT